MTGPVRDATGGTLAELYSAILADPDDERPRLAYADAIAADQPCWAELIRVQLAYSRDRRDHVDWEPRRTVQMFELARCLRDEIVSTDVHGLAGRFGLGGGFVETVAVNIDEFIDSAGRMLDTYPLKMVMLTGLSMDRIDRLSRLPELERLRGLSLARGSIGDDGLRMLLTSPHLTRLRWLDLTRTGVTADGVEALAAAGVTPELRYVAADSALALNPEPAFDWDGTLVYIVPASLADRLGARYDVAWLHRGTRDIRGYPGGGPAYDEV
jgi:uncharacterized protein (TIGR02996 family)